MKMCISPVLKQGGAVMCEGGEDASEVPVFVELCVCYCKKWQNTLEEM